MSNTIRKKKLLKWLDNRILEYKDSNMELHKWKAEGFQDLVGYIKSGFFDTDGWISVKERMPEVNDGEWAAFIIPSRFGAKTVSTIAARYMAGKWSNNEVIRATYWMPLPEPPKEV